MSLAKRYLERYGTGGPRSPADFVCDACFDDKTLEDFVRTNAAQNECDFCGRQSDAPIAAATEDVIELITKGIESEWTERAEETPYEGGYVWPNVDLPDILAELDDPIRTEAFQEALEDALIEHDWIKRDYVALPLDEALSTDWDRFVEAIKHESRFFFLLSREDRIMLEPGQLATVLELLQSIAVLANMAGLIREIPTGTAFWRARPHQESEHFQSAAELGTVPVPYALVSNRMSPAGIPAFYGSESLDTALAEVAASKRPDQTRWSAGLFETTAPALVLDLSDLAEPPSIFDPERRNLRRPLMFLAQFAEEVRRPLADSDREQIDYVPTQVVSEFLRVSYESEDERQLQGLLYRSAQDEDGVCVALFTPNERCLDDQPACGDLALLRRQTEHGEFANADADQAV
ncbi:MAG: HEPN-associated N-terminal domain-containing protein [Actinomycetota bacterium]|nr:HEPN-associated N-terminal domain-containing protein [Actinomycetota bacterium]